MPRDTCVTTAAVRLMLFYPFWCELYYTMKVVECDHIPTLCTDGRTMWVCPAFWDKLTLDYKVSALAHETCHKMLHHCTRGLGHDPFWANIAMDIVVNTLLHENGFKIHKDWVQPEPKYSGWTYEAVYHDITKDLKQPPPQSGGGKPPEEDDDEQEQPGGGGGDDEDGEDDGAGDGEESKDGKPKDGKGKGGKDDKDGPPSGAGGFCDRKDIPAKYRGAWKDVTQFVGTPEQIENFEEQVEQQVQQALAAAKALGHSPAGIEMAMEKVTKIADEKWYDHLQRFFQSLRLAEYDWKKINRRYAMKYRVVAPVQYTERLGPVLIFADASGSCWTQAIQAGFASHVNAILAEAMPERTWVAFFDTMVHKCVEVDPGTIEFQEPPAGGGGTSIAWLNEWIEESGIVPSVVIILTDMYIQFPTEEPEYPVIWASITPNMKGPFGDTIHIH